MGQTKIQWCDKSWNPVTGCSHSGSPGCDHCYAKRMATRLQGRYGYPRGWASGEPEGDPFKVTFHPDKLDEPLRWKKPSRIFVCSMGDIGHDQVDYRWFSMIMATIQVVSQHNYLMLTKRPGNLKELLKTWKSENIKNLWLGVSVENQRTADERIPILLQIPAVKRFVSCEPLLGEIWFRKGIYQVGTHEELYGTSLNGIDWVICGGETGPGARPLHLDWIRSLRDQCQAAGVPFFFKGWGEWFPVGEKLAGEFKPIGKGDALKRLHLWPDQELSMRTGRKAAGRFLDGREWSEYPK